MKMKLIRITMSLISALFVFALIACDLEAPQSVRIKSHPGLYLSLGSPFAGTEMSLSEYLSVEGLEKQLGGDNGAIDILRWDEYSEKDVQAYRVRYPVADININLSEYVEDMDVASKLSGASGSWIPSNLGSDIPLPLDSMSFAHNVTNVTISVTLTFGTADTVIPPNISEVPDVPAGVAVTFKGAVFNGNTNGTPSDSSPNTWSSPQIAVFNPATDKISIGVTVPAGTWFKPSLEFEWASADISIGAGGTQEGSYELDFSGFGSFMGEGVSFKEITGYMYLKKPGEGDSFKADATVKLIWKKPSGDDDATIQPINEDFPQDWKTKFSSPTDTSKAIDLKELFTYPLEFKYTLTLTEVTIQSSNNPDGKISVDMVILLPMEFTLDDSLKSNNTYSNSSDSYRKLELEMLQGLGEGGGGDLFGRTDEESGDDDMFNNLQGVKLIFSHYVNEAIDGLSFGYWINDTEGWKILDLTKLDNKEKEEEIELDADDIKYPFNPKFELLVSDADTLKIKRAPRDNNNNPRDAEIDFKIAVEAETDLNYQVKF